MRPKTHSATLREQRRKAMRDKSAAVAGAVRHKQVMLPGNLRFSADCITYKVGPPQRVRGASMSSLSRLHRRGALHARSASGPSRVYCQM